MRETVNWRAFLKRHDLLWSRLPETWEEGSFHGNGMMGSLFYKEPGANALHLEVCRSDVQDHRDKSFDGMGAASFSRCRLPIGYFLISPKGSIVSGNMRLDLWNAETNGTLNTECGSLVFRTYVHTEEPAIVLEMQADGESGIPAISWHGAEAVSPRQTYMLERGNSGMKDYKLNPPFEVSKSDEVNVCVQSLLAGGQTATAWIEISDKKNRTLLVSTAHSFPEDDAADNAVSVVRRLAAMEPEERELTHRRWWHDFYPASFVSIPDAKIESFYWIQIYKLGSATRADGALIDNHGPWLEKTRWPYATWNMNVQLSYWPVYTSNHLELGESLCRTFDSQIENLINNVPEEYRHDSAAIGRATTLDCIGDVELELHNLPWACHNYWLQYRYSMDDSMLRSRLFPLLRRSINFILHFIEEKKDGNGNRIIHLSPMLRGEQDVVPDNTAVLALLRWGCEALIWSCGRLGIDDPLLPRWQDVLEHLTDYPSNNEVGLLHYTKSMHPADYLLAVYPLHILTTRNPEQRKLVNRSLSFWYDTIQKMPPTAGWRFAHGAAMMACEERYETAYELLRSPIDSMLFTANTMYREATPPVIESPLAAAAAINELLIQSWGGEIRVFPGIPDTWQNVTIHNLRTEGAFLVTAVRKAGKTVFVRVRSLAGEPLRIRPGIEQPVTVDGGVREATGGKPAPPDDVYELDLRKGEEAVFYTGGCCPDIEIGPVSTAAENHNFYGLK